MSKPRFEKWKYRDKEFRYDHLYHVIEYGYYDDGKFVDLDCAGLMLKNWQDMEMRRSYVDQWIDDLDDEAQYLIESFIRDELPGLM